MTVSSYLTCFLRAGTKERDSLRWPFQPGANWVGPYFEELAPSVTAWDFGRQSFRLFQDLEYCKKQYFYICSSAAIAKNTLIINVFETSSRKTLQHGVGQQGEIVYIIFLWYLHVDLKQCFWFIWIAPDALTGDRWLQNGHLSPCFAISPNSVCLRGSNDVSVPGSKRVPFFLTCPGFRFYGPRNTFHAHARYLVMVSRRFDGKKHCFNAGSSAAITKSILIINVFETSWHKTQ